MLATVGHLAIGSVAGWSAADLLLTHFSAGAALARWLRRSAYGLALVAFPATAALFGGWLAVLQVAVGAGLGAGLRMGLMAVLCNNKRTVT